VKPARLCDSLFQSFGAPKFVRFFLEHPLDLKRKINSDLYTARAVSTRRNDIVLIISDAAASPCRVDEENAVDAWTHRNVAITRLQNDAIVKCASHWTQIRPATTTGATTRRERARHVTADAVDCQFCSVDVAARAVSWARRACTPPATKCCRHPPVKNGNLNVPSR